MWPDSSLVKVLARSKDHMHNLVEPSRDSGHACRDSRELQNPP